MTPLQGMGIQLSFEPGPVVSEPIRTDAQIEALPELVAARDVPFVLESIKLIRPNLPRGAPLIGFAGGPFTLLCYLVCGRPSKEFAAARTFLYAQPHAAQRLLERLADAMAEYLAAQAGAGAQALMLFESWAGLLGVREFTGFALAAVQRTAAALRRLSVPLIYYVNQGSHLMSAVAPLDVDVIGVDWRTGLAEVRRVLGPARRCRVISIRRRSLPRRRRCAARSIPCSSRRAPTPGTSSTWVTASGPTPIRMPSRASSTTCMSEARS